MTYARLKKLISRGAYDKEDMMNKLRRIPDGEPHHGGAVSGVGWYDGVML